MAHIRSVDDIDDSIVPGTVRLVDIEGRLRTKHAKGNLHDVVLVPTPTDDPDDPLNWSPRRKALSAACWILFTLFSALASAVVYSVIVPFSHARHITPIIINRATGYFFLSAGYTLLFWQPLALQYGKRPVYLISVLGQLGMTLWAPYTKGNGQWIAKNVLQGFFIAPIEALPELSVADVFFTHQRGNYMALYSLCLVSGGYIAPIISGWINDGQGYKWVFYYPAIFLGVVFLFMFFFMEETNYDRNYVGVIEDTFSTDSSRENIDPEKVSRPETKSSLRPTVKKTYLQKLSLITTSRKQLMFHRLKQQIAFLFWPNVIFAGWAYGSTLIWYNVLNATASLILSAAPYHFSAGIVGTIYVAGLIGATIGWLYCGKISDWMMIKLARRNGGIMEPEQRLWLFAASCILVPFALILWGVGAAHDIHWSGLLCTWHSSSPFPAPNLSVTRLLLTSFHSLSCRRHLIVHQHARLLAQRQLSRRLFQGHER